MVKRYILVLIFLIIKSAAYCQKQAPDTFTASFNEIIYAFADNFESIKGKLDTSVRNIMIWKSKIKLPDAEDGFIVFDKNIFKDEKYTEFNERIFKSSDKKLAWKQYIDFIERINHAYSACCNLKKSPNSEEKQDSLKSDYSTYFYVENVKNENVTKRFTYLKIQIQFKTGIDADYEVKMHICDTNYY